MVRDFFFVKLTFSISDEDAEVERRLVDKIGADLVRLDEGMDEVERRLV